MAEKRSVDICEDWECWSNSYPSTSWEVDVRFSYLSYRWDVVLNVKTGLLVEDSDVRRLRSELSDLDERLPEITRRLIAIGKWDLPFNQQSASGFMCSSTLEAVAKMLEEKAAIHEKRAEESSFDVALAAVAVSLRIQAKEIRAMKGTELP